MTYTGRKAANIFFLCPETWDIQLFMLPTNIAFVNKVFHIALNILLFKIRS